MFQTTVVPEPTEASNRYQPPERGGFPGEAR